MCIISWVQDSILICIAEVVWVVWDRIGLDWIGLDGTRRELVAYRVSQGEEAVRYSGCKEEGMFGLEGHCFGGGMEVW